MGISRLYREGVTRAGGTETVYCDHPDCIGAWNECVRRCCVVQPYYEFQVWLLEQERKGNFGDRVCLGITRPYVVGVR